MKLLRANQNQQEEEQFNTDLIRQFAQEEFIPSVLRLEKCTAVELHEILSAGRIMLSRIRTIAAKSCMKSQESSRIVNRESQDRLQKLLTVVKFVERNDKTTRRCSEPACCKPLISGSGIKSLMNAHSAVCVEDPRISAAGKSSDNWPKLRITLKKDEHQSK